jgi:hypothetical protein
MAVDIAYRLEEQHKIILDQLLYTFDAVIGSGNAACYIELNKFRALLDSFSKEKISPLFIDVDLGKNISHFKILNLCLISKIILIFLLWAAPI